MSELELLIEGMGEFVVAMGEGCASSEAVFSLRQAPGCLVELVERDCSFVEFKRAVDITAFQACVAGPLQEGPRRCDRRAEREAKPRRQPVGTRNLRAAIVLPVGLHRQHEPCHQRIPDAHPRHARRPSQAIRPREALAEAHHRQGTSRPFPISRSPTPPTTMASSPTTQMSAARRWTTGSSRSHSTAPLRS
jgi:predicted nuclease with RNAse H fold